MATKVTFNLFHLLNNFRFASASMNQFQVAGRLVTGSELRCSITRNLYWKSIQPRPLAVNILFLFCAKMEDTIRRLSVEIDEDNIEKGALNVLREIRPDWPLNDIKFKLLTDGITNKLVKCYLKDNPNNVVLVRVYGRKTDMLIDRKAETRNIFMLHKENLAPQLFAAFKNGLAYDFAPGVTLTSKSVTQPNIYLLVAAQMAKLHRVQPTNTNNQPMMWNKLQQFFELIPEEFSHIEMQNRFEEMLYPKTRLLQEMLTLKDLLRKLNSPIVFAHNDLLLGNVIYDSNKETVTFIDYEYAAMNYQAFDIGNHFAEFAGVESVDFSYIPSKDLQIKWLRRYLQVFHNKIEIDDEEIGTLYLQVNKFILASHLFWGFWALIQAEHSKISFDFLQYAKLRLDEYFSKKEEYLAS